MDPKPDIKDWTDGSAAYRRLVYGAAPGTPSFHRKRVPLNLDVPRTYALLKTCVSERPNGVLSSLGRGKPLDNIVWWDFVLTSGPVVVTVQRTVNQLEADIFVEDAKHQFDVAAFLRNNLQKHKTLIDASLATFERHSVYLNHYYSYRQCAKLLREEVDAIDLTVPEVPAGGIVHRREDLDTHGAAVTKFMRDSERFHVLAKSLILHSAFMAEAGLNNLFRIGSAPPLRVSAPAMKLCLTADFPQKLRVLRAFTVILKQDVDMKARQIQGALKLMELRNKYVHSDESEFIRLGEVFYDGDYPLLPVTGHAPPVELALRAFHTPTREDVRAAHDAASAFVDYLLELVDPRLRDTVQKLLMQHHLGFNETKKVYSLVYDEQAPMIALVTSDEHQSRPN